MLPIIAFVIAFARQIIGWKAFGIYTPLITAFAFYSIGLKYGLIIFITIIATGTLVRFAIKYLHLLYLPRIAIVLSFVALIILILSMIMPSEVYLSILPILIIITLLEEFIGAQTKKNLKAAIIMSLETILLAIVCYYLIIWPGLQKLLLSHPWIIFIAIILNIALGKWTGLRLSEYFRFRQVIKHVELSKKK